MMTQRFPARLDPLTSVQPKSQANADLQAACLERELQWFESVLHQRLARHLDGEVADPSPVALPPPDLPQFGPYAETVRLHGLGWQERLILMLCMAPALRPQALDPLIHQQTQRGNCEFGGWQGKVHAGFLPTAETAVFLLAGTDLGQRLHAQELLRADAPLCQGNLIQLQSGETGEPPLSALLTMPAGSLARLCTGQDTPLALAGNLPAQPISTLLDWSDLVLPEALKAEVERVHTWQRFAARIMHDWGLARILQPGYRVLFYGPPGTGKTLAASLLGKRLGTTVMRVDLSQVSSKYIGETEKNLARLFDQAQHRNWILFFDEADTLFGKRTREASVNDRHANQETAYLLQRIEYHPGIVILATNLAENIDEAFFRRFQATLAFPMPDAGQRLKLWQQGLACAPTSGLDLGRLADAYSLSGGAINNAIRQAALRALEAGRAAITQQDLLDGLAQKLDKSEAQASPARPPVMIRGPFPN